MSVQTVDTVDTYETHAPDPMGWRGVPFRLPDDVPAHTADADGGKHDGGPKPPEAPREPSGGDGQDGSGSGGGSGSACPE
ncbi:hypothetical protein [Streptomyces paludis]|uniref:Uncharacterized protein n=1 Tax=Streptomyces paludis TaxID=2282738 RepID=A0A345HRI1_9ACTN|nr:hypothetical protein [Streptomyces paludis]AXG79305.1 hypothetical protein DVK44_18440 [Streptomyces paludis]